MEEKSPLCLLSRRIDRNRFKQTKQRCLLCTIDFCKMYDMNFNRGNIVKYLARAGKKDNELDDLRKALNYLLREIEHHEKLQEQWIENNK